MYNQAYSQIGHSQQEYYILRGFSLSTISLDSNFTQKLVMISSIIKPNFKYNNYNKPYSKLGFSNTSQEFKVYKSNLFIGFDITYTSQGITEDNFLSNVVFLVENKSIKIAQSNLLFRGDTFSR